MLLAPGPAFLEEFARSALQTGRWNEVIPLQSIHISFDHVKQSRDLRLSDWPEFIHHEFRFLGFNEVMKLNPVFFSSGGFPIENSIRARLGFSRVGEHVG